MINTKFASFETGLDYMSYRGDNYKVEVAATSRLNDWLKEHPNVEILKWHTCSVGEENRLCITVEYRE
jgi:hypothetical protein